jgi:molybdopterin-guanine dinucleotide biosynthesis protein A
MASGPRATIPTTGAAKLQSIFVPRFVTHGGKSKELLKLTQFIGGIVLCGGRSSRMGRPKLSLPFGSETMLLRVVRTLAEVVSPIVVVAAHNQELPELPCETHVVRDEHEYLGPLAGIERGLSVLRDLGAQAAYVSSCDVPLLRPTFIAEIIRRLKSHELAVPREGEFHHPLAGVYRTSLVDRVHSLVVQERLRPLFLIQESDSVEIPVDELRGVDPELQSLRNVNRPEDYAAVLQLAGLA